MTEVQPLGADLVRNVRAALVEAAAEGRTISYRDLAVRACIPPPYRIHRLTLALEGMLRADLSAGRPLVAALAVSRGPEGIPGRGFFDLCRDLGLYDGPDRGPAAVAFHASLLRDVISGDATSRMAASSGVIGD